MNTELFYNRALEYQNKRNAAIAEYDGTMKKIASAKGSEFYDDAAREARDKKAAALSALKSEYTPMFNDIFSDMEAKNSSRGLKAPTAEELSIIQLLKLKKSVSKADLDAAAVSLKNNSSCLTILSEMARESGIFASYDNYGGNREMSIEAAGNAIDALRSSTADFLSHTTTRAARLYVQHRGYAYGDADNQELPARPNFSDKAGCFAEIGGMNEGELAAFEAAVD